ncbi:MAG: ribosome maturation factor RimP [Endomicrobium sp.]|jgi:ribosome maturation factor RimP|nr:ribosome maturation factor RimP [Endomicrobium sp.]
MNKIEEIKILLDPIAKISSIEIVDIQYVKENGVWILRIFIDKDGGVTISDCENISNVFGVILDESNVLKNSYYILEISSPGLNRVLKKKESFKRFIGSVVRIQTFELINNQRNFLGKLLDFKNNKLKIDDVTNGIVGIKFLNIKKANVVTDHSI